MVLTHLIQCNSNQISSIARRSWKGGGFGRSSDSAYSPRVHSVSLRDADDGDQRKLIKFEYFEEFSEFLPKNFNLEYNPNLRQGGWEGVSGEPITVAKLCFSCQFISWRPWGEHLPISILLLLCDEMLEFQIAKAVQCTKEYPVFLLTKWSLHYVVTQKGLP